MAKHEGDFQAAAEISLELGEWLRALETAGLGSDRARQEAIACCLSGSEGWRAAADKLGGAFAPGAGLTSGKDE